MGESFYVFVLDLWRDNGVEWSLEFSCAAFNDTLFQPFFIDRLLLALS